MFSRWFDFNEILKKKKTKVLTFQRVICVHWPVAGTALVPSIKYWIVNLVIDAFITSCNNEICLEELKKQTFPLDSLEWRSWTHFNLSRTKENSRINNNYRWKSLSFISGPNELKKKRINWWCGVRTAHCVRTLHSD